MISVVVMCILTLKLNNAAEHTKTCSIVFLGYNNLDLGLPFWVYGFLYQM